ncbi:MAG: PKD domain-containing protein, partial [Bacteroidetes bacterium]|nr:PKD domain-containing protein [Bacteroidota bacterium]
MKQFLPAILLLFFVSSQAQAQQWVESMQDESVNVYQAIDEFEKFWEGKVVEKGHGWKQFKRWEQFWEPRVYPHGNRPNGSAVFQANSQIQASTAANPGLGNWSLVGPSNGNALQGIGRVNSITFHPNNSQTIYAGAPAGGLWKSTNDGGSWTTNTDKLPNIGISTMVIDPLHPDTMYVGTGDRDAGDTYSTGVLKSVDAGATWQATGLTFGISQFKRITGMVIHPDSTNWLVVSTRTGMYRTTDGGDNWTLIQGGTFQSLTTVVGAEHLLYAGTRTNAKIWYSRDFGISWTMAITGLPVSGTSRAELATTAADTNYVYAIYGASNNGLYGVYRSTNKGVSWTQMHGSTPNLLGWSTTGAGTGGQAWYDLTIAASPLNKDVILIGGVNIWRSNNGGSSFGLSGHWYGGGGASFVHADHHWLTFRPNSNKVYAGTDGGVYRSTNSGLNNSWVARNDGMAITMYYKISTSAANSNLTLAGAQDNGTHLKNNTWSRVGGGDGMDNGIAGSDAMVMYRSIYYGDFDKSVNGGGSFNAPFNLPPSGNGNWVTPFVVSVINANTLYAGFEKLWKSSNAGSSFSATTTTGIWGSNKIDVIAEAPSNASVLYVGINQRVYRSVNGGGIWTHITNNVSNQNTVTGIAVDPANADHIAITKSGYSVDKVYESYDGGSSWYNRTGSLPNIPANCVAFEPGSNGLLYVGTDVGVYFRDASMSDWLPFMDGLPNTIINDIEILQTASVNLIRVGTYGRGVWESPLASTFLDIPVAAFDVAPEALCAIGDSIQLHDQSLNMPGNWAWTIHPQTFSYASGSSSSSQNPIIIPTATGNYSIQLIAGNSYGSDTSVVIHALAVGGILTPVNEEFKGALPNRWAIENPDNDRGWNMASLGHLDSVSAVMRFFNYSNIGQVDALISPPYAIDSNSTLIYDLAYQMKTGNASDTLRIMASTDCGATWQLLFTGSDDGTGNFATAASSINAFVPTTSAQWRTDTLALGNLSGTVTFKFEGVNAGGNHLYLDHLRLLPASLATPVAAIFSTTAACQGSSVTYHSASTGESLSHAWSFPGGSPSSSVAVNPVVTYANSGSCSVSLTVSNTAGSDAITMSNHLSVTTAVSPSIALTASSMPACQGDTVTFVASTINSGSNPVYQWMINGQISGSSSSTFSSFTLNTGDSVTCLLRSDAYCAAPSELLSAPSVVSIYSLPTVSAGSYPSVCTGGSDIPL